jgi:hypothetical protein
VGTVRRPIIQLRAREKQVHRSSTRTKGDTVTNATYYKWLTPERRTSVQSVKWPKRVGAWTKDTTPILCKSGWHAMKAGDALKHLPSMHATLWEVEGRGAMVEGNDKVAFASMRLVREIATTDDRLLRLFAVACARDVLHIYEDKYPNDSRVRDCIDVAERFANGEATNDEMTAAWAAAGDAAGAAAGAAAWDAAGAAAWDAAGAAAWDAAWAAAWAAAGAAGAIARAAARAAAWDAQSLRLVAMLEEKGKQ